LNFKTSFSRGIIWLILSSRYYKISESKERVPKIANYYKNYLTFFCNPIFRNFKINALIQQYSDNKAEFYFNKTYSNKPKKDKKATSFLFNTQIKKDIDEQMLTIQITEDKNIINNNDCNNNSIFNDEFFIYRPEKKRYVDGNLDNSDLALDYSRNCSMKSGLMTIQTKEDELINLVSKLSNQPLNEIINDKIQQKSTKKTVKSYNFSTTDKTNKSKGDSQNILNNLNKANNQNIYSNKQESYQLHELMSKKSSVEFDNLDPNHISNINNNNKNTTKTPIPLNNNITKNSYDINFRNNPSPITYIQRELSKPQFRTQNIPEGIKNGNSLVPNSSKNKLLINNPEYVTQISKLSCPTTVKQQKFNYAISSLKNASNTNNKGIEYKTIKLKPNNSNSKFANLLIASNNENNFKMASTLNRAGSNPLSSKIPIKAIRNLDIVKYNEDIKSPANYQTNNLQDIRNYELNIKVKSDFDEVQQVKPMLSVHLDKVFKVRQPSYENFLNNGNNGPTRGKQKTEKISYNFQEDLLIDDTKQKKISLERSTKQLTTRDNNNNNNALLENNSKIVNYLNNSKKIICTGNSEDSNNNNKILSSLANTKSTINNNNIKIKYNINEKSPSDQANQNIASALLNEGKLKLQSKYFHIEQRALASTRAYSKSKETAINDPKLTKTPLNHNRIKSVDYYSNNYVISNNLNHMNNAINPQNSNANHIANVNSFLHKIASTKNVISNNNGESNTKKINFSPQNNGKR